MSLVPDIAINAKSLSKESRERFAGVLLFMDVSGNITAYKFYCFPSKNFKNSVLKHYFLLNILIPINFFIF